LVSLSAGTLRRPARNDLVAAAVLTAALVISPITGAARPLISLALGVAGGCAYLAYRLRRPAAPRPAALGLALGWKSQSLLAAFAFSFVPTSVWLYGEYTHSIWHNAHGVFVPLAIALHARAILRKTSLAEIEGSLAGFAFLIPACALVALDSGVRSGYVSALALVLSLPGVSLLLLGKRITRRLAFPLAFALFAVPIPNALANHLWLTQGTAAGVEWLLQFTGLHFSRFADTFFFDGGSLSISNNCSGISTFWSALALAVFQSASPQAWSRRVLILAAVWPLTVGINSLRALFLLLMCVRAGMGFLDTPLHGLSGIATFGAVVGAIAWLSGPRRLAKMIE
jgi:exosortase